MSGEALTADDGSMLIDTDGAATVLKDECCNLKLFKCIDNTDSGLTIPYATGLGHASEVFKRDLDGHCYYIHGGTACSNEAGTGVWHPDCSACCNYMRAYTFDGILHATDLYLLASEVVPNKVLKTGGGDTGELIVCYKFFDCYETVPEGGSLINPAIIRGWFDSFGSCECTTDSPIELVISVVQEAIICCQAHDDFGFPFTHSRALTQGTASGTWTIPLTPAGGSIIVPGVMYRKIVYGGFGLYAPFDKIEGCVTGFQAVDPDCCDDGTTVNEYFDMLIEQVGGEVRASIGGCLLWRFGLPFCTDVNTEGELVATEVMASTEEPEGVNNCGYEGGAFGVCLGLPEATATMALRWAA